MQTNGGGVRRTVIDRSARRHGESEGIMRRGRFTAGLSALIAAALLGAPGAFAASPKAIYRDYQDNGRLDGNYSPADLQRALKDVVLQGYPKTGGNVAPKIHTKMTQPRSGVLGAPPVTRTATRPTLPFTGVDLALMTVGGLSLLGLGAGLRKLARNKA